MRGPFFAVTALLCSGCLKSPTCMELLSCPVETDDGGLSADGGQADVSTRPDVSSPTSAESARRSDASVETPSNVHESDAGTSTSSVVSLATPDASANTANDADATSSVDASDASRADVSSVNVSDVSSADVSGTSNDVPRVVQLAAGGSHTCAVVSDGRVRCWGHGSFGQLGYGNTNTIGDDEEPASAGDVDVGGTVIQLAAGALHTCALLDGGRVRCWGEAPLGQLGYANVNTIGDDETPASAGDVDVGGAVIQLVAGSSHTCAVLENGRVRCWGASTAGQLGYGHTNAIGDDENPATAGDVNLGGDVTQLAAGSYHTCAVLKGGWVRCWGYNRDGQLGYGNTNNIGDDETPASAGDVNVGGPVTQIAAGANHTCALLENGRVRCWGWGHNARLGYGNINTIGDDEHPATAGDVDVGGTVIQLAAGGGHTCALLENRRVRCWGAGTDGRLGYGNINTIGDDEAPATAGDVNVGSPVIQLAAGAWHTCALLENGQVRCWGSSFNGKLGYGNTNAIGDDEAPATAGNVNVLGL